MRTRGTQKATAAEAAKAQPRLRRLIRLLSRRCRASQTLFLQEQRGHKRCFIVLLMVADGGYNDETCKQVLKEDV